MNKLLILAAAAAALSLPGLASAADVSGAWKLAVNVGDMTYHTNCALMQDGATLSGTCTPADPPPDGGDAPKPVAVTGTVDGSNVKFAYDMTFGDMMIHLAYTGALTSDTVMAGKLNVADMDVDFTGTKS
jgi:opacity protein-like surface antigen